MHPVLARQLQAGAETIELEGLDLSPVDIEHLVDYVPNVPIKSLNVASNELTDEACRKLCSAGWLRTLETLDLSWNDLGPASIESLCDAHFDRLKTLSLNLNDVGDRGIAILTASRLVAQLEGLSLAHCKLGQDGVNALFSSNAVKLIVLDLRGAPVSTHALRALGERGHLTRLETLNISDNALGPESLDHEDIVRLVDSPRLPCLQKLIHLAPRIWGDAGIVDLARRRR